MQVNSIASYCIPKANYINQPQHVSQAVFTGIRQGDSFSKEKSTEQAIDDFFFRMEDFKNEAKKETHQMKSVAGKTFMNGTRKGFEGQEIINVNKQSYYVFYSEGDKYKIADLVRGKKHWTIYFDKNAEKRPKSFNTTYEDENTRSHIDIVSGKIKYGKEDKNTGDIQIIVKDRYGHMYEESNENSPNTYARGYERWPKREFESRLKTDTPYGTKEFSSKYTKTPMSSKWESQK